jgi:hypothetical protein
LAARIGLLLGAEFIAATGSATRFASADALAGFAASGSCQRRPAPIPALRLTAEEDLLHLLACPDSRTSHLGRLPVPHWNGGGTMTIRQFVAHREAAGSRLFAVDRDGADRLEAVAVLGSADVERTDELVGALDLYLSMRDESALENSLRGLPDAVVLPIREFLRSRCPREPGTFGPWGFLTQVRRSYLAARPRTVEEYLSGAFVVGLGIRAEKAVDEHDVARWDVVLLSGLPFVPRGGGGRAWPPPDGSRVDSTWIRGTAPGQQIPAALAVAEEAAALGKRVRVHTYQQGDGEHWLDGAMSTEVVVDVFAEPPPPYVR